MFLKINILIAFLFAMNSLQLLSLSESKQFKLIESDSIFFQSIKNLDYTPNLEYFIVNQKTETNRISVFKKDGSLFKTYLIDDAYTFKYIDSIYYDKSEVLMNISEYESTIGSTTKSEFTNTISQSSFANDSTVISIGTLKYLVHFTPLSGQPHFKLNKVTVLFILNINNNEFKIKPLRFNKTKVNPQPDYINVFNNQIYFKLFPEEYFREVPNSLKYTLGKINIAQYNWEPLLEIPNEYDKSNIKLDVDFSYRINEYRNSLFFMAPFTNYLFNLEQDTIWPSDLVNPIKYSLDHFNSETINLPKEIYKLDSVSHMIMDFFFINNNLYVILIKPKNKDSRIHINKYTLKGQLLETKVINENQKLETVFFSENKQNLYKVYMVNEEWWIEEIDLD